MGIGTPELPLTRELACFRAKLAELAESDLGRFVLIRADNVLGCFDTDVDALRAGFETCGLAPFLVRQVTREPVRMVPRFGVTRF